MRDRLYVVTNGPAWKVRCEHCGQQDCSTQAEAIRVARNHVRQFPPGTLSQILVQGVGSAFRTEWTYGADPYPPPG
jgi:hypothetical protein